MHTRKDLLAKGLQRSDSNNYAEDIDGADSAYDYRKSAIKPQRNGRQPDSISPLSTSTTGRVRPVSFNNNNSRFSDFGNDDYYDELSEKVFV